MPKHPFGIVVGSLRHHVPGGLGQLAGQGFGRNDGAGFACLAIVPFAARFIVAPREVGRFDKGPGQIFVAALGAYIPWVARGRF